MASSSKDVPHQRNNKSDGSGDGVATTKEHRATHPTITALRIPAKSTIPHLVTLPLVRATSDYHFNFHNSQHSTVDDVRDINRPSSKLLKLTVGDTQIDVSQSYYSLTGLNKEASPILGEPERHLRLRSTSSGKGFGTFPDVPLADESGNPGLTFTHASLRLQPYVIGSFWLSMEAWRRRAFKRLYTIPREGAGLEMMTGEYHIMYTYSRGFGVRPNLWADLGVHGDAFILKMASEKNEQGDWYYEDMPREILDCSFVNQCLETLRSVRPITYQKMVGERGDGPPGVISHGTGLKVTRPSRLVSLDYTPHAPANNTLNISEAVSHNYNNQTSASSPILVTTIGPLAPEQNEP